MTVVLVVGILIGLALIRVLLFQARPVAASL